MSVAVTAVPVVAYDVQAVPLAGAHIEQPLLDFVAGMRASALSDELHLANPSALAAELFGSLRGYIDRARSFETTARIRASETEGGAGIDMASLTPADTAETEMHGGPARERLEPRDPGSGVSPAVAVSLAQLQRTMDVALASMNFATETALVVRGTSQISHSANTLLKGQ